MDSARQEITSALQKALDELGIEETPTLSIPSSSEHGDFTTNMALVASKKAKKNPMELAEEIVGNLKLEIGNLKFIDKIDVARPGFINFYLSKEYLLKQLKAATPLRSSSFEGQRKVMLEFADPNPFKEFHIGHLRNITLGESFARLLESQGAEVWRVNYQGDVGMHVAKALFGMMQLKDQIPSDDVSLNEKAAFLGKAYAYGAKAYEEDPKAKEEIQTINKQVYKKDPELLPLWEKGRQWSMDRFEEIYKRVGTKYKRYYLESEVADPGREIVLSHLDDGIFEKTEGAIVYRGEKEGLHTRVFVTKEDYATYEAKDLALAPLKYKDYQYDRSIIITAHEQAPYFQVVLAALKKIDPSLAKKTEHYSFGFVRLKEGKMSSRTGNIITGEWLLNEAKSHILKLFPDMDSDTAEKVAVGAVKYSMLKFAKESDIAFSFEESISLEGNSGPYLQYTFVRTQSILKKVKNQNAKGKITIQNSKLEPEELTLLRLLNRFPVVIEEAASQFAPNVLANYLFELAQKFNLFYQKHKILESEQKDLRLMLTEGVGKVLKEGLSLLGIQAPEKM